MALELWQSKLQLRTYTFYPSRSEFISTDSIFAEWVCIVPVNGKFEYETEVSEGEIETGEIEFGDLIFVRPRAVFNRHVTASPLAYHVLQWSFVDEENQVQENLWRAGKWTVRDTTRLSATLAVLRPLLGRHDAWSVRRREHLLEEILHLAWEAHQASPNLDPLMSEAARLLRERAGELLTMSEISGSIGLGPVQFTRRFRAVYGQNPVEYLTELRLEIAQRMLIETPATLDEIAAKCGWASGAYLSYVFEKTVQNDTGPFSETASGLSPQTQFELNYLAVMQNLIQQAAQAITDCDNLLICAGAGIGVDSGMPDFRGNDGFWKAYPAFKHLGLEFQELAQPKWFTTDPHLAWGFYGHRLNLYRATEPHHGFQILRKFCEGKSHFIFTSNVDGHFQKAGFSSFKIAEYHGSIHHFQPVTYDSRTTANIWSAEGIDIQVDEETFRAVDPLPRVPNSDALARPNVLMFGDNKWLSTRSDKQNRRENEWLESLKGKNVVIELGAGTAVPSVRHYSQQFVRLYGATLIRINPREAHGPQGTISLEYGSLEGLQLIEAEMNR